MHEMRMCGLNNFYFRESAALLGWVVSTQSIINLKHNLAIVTEIVYNTFHWCN